MEFKETEWKGMERIHVVLDRNNLRAPVNTKINFWFVHNGVNSLTS